MYFALHAGALFLAWIIWLLWCSIFKSSFEFKLIYKTISKPLNRKGEKIFFSFSSLAAQPGPAGLPSPAGPSHLPPLSAAAAQLAAHPALATRQLRIRATPPPSPSPPRSRTGSAARSKSRTASVPCVTDRWDPPVGPIPSTRTRCGLEPSAESVPDSPRRCCASPPSLLGSAPHIGRAPALLAILKP